LEYEQISSEEGEKYIPADPGITNTEWSRVREMDLWTSKSTVLPDAKWLQENFPKDNESTSQFHYLITITDTPPPVTFEEMLEGWRDASTVGTPDTRSVLIHSLSRTEKLTELIERTVHTMCPPLDPVIDRLFAMVKDKDTLHGELKQIILSMPPPPLHHALDLMSLQFE
jgi:hypothetical protein